MPEIEIIPARPEHIRIILSDLEGLSKEDAYRYGGDSEAALLKVLRKSLFTDAGFVDGKLVGIYGILGEYLGQEGFPWSLLTPSVEKYPFHMVTFYRRALNKMLRLFPVLVDMVDVRHEKTLRMLKIMGFEFGEPHPFMGATFVKAVWREKCQED